MSAILALVDGQGEAVVAFLGYHPVVHVPQPVELAAHAEFWYPRDLLGHLGDVVAQLVHRDEPLVHEPEDEFRVAAPADGVSVG